VRAFPLLLVASLAACGGDHAVIDARMAAPGARVTVDGVVTVPSGVIDAGFALSDGANGVHVAADSAYICTELRGLPAGVTLTGPLPRHASHAHGSGMSGRARIRETPSRCWLVFPTTARGGTRG